MIMSFKSSTAIAALLAVAGLGLAAMPAAAADLGGDCCADLEERIAELEATTVRKGNRKVKLEVSGHVNQALIVWDDGVEQNAGFYTNDNSRTRFRFKGSAKVTEDVKAGFLLEIGVRSANSKRFTQDDPVALDESGLDVRHSAWYLESKSYGTVWLGTTGPAAESITEINLAQTKDVAKFSDIEDTALGLNIRFLNGNIGVRDNGGTAEAVSYRRLIDHSGDQPGESERGPIVKYVTPEFQGFTATTAWGGDDYWDVGVNYKGEFSGFKLAAGIAYGEETSADGDAGIIDSCLTDDGLDAGLGSDAKCRQVGGSMSVMHEPSGIYVNFAAGWREDELIDKPGLFTATGVGADPESTFWALEGGIEQKFFPIGKTTLFGQYYDFEGGSNDNRRLSFTGNTADQERIANTEVQMYGGGVVQGIDAAAMSLYAYYRHYEFGVSLIEGDGTPVANPGIEDVDVFVAGGIIKF